MYGYRAKTAAISMGRLSAIARPAPAVTTWLGDGLGQFVPLHGDVPTVLPEPVWLAVEGVVLLV